MGGSCRRAVLKPEKAKIRPVGELGKLADSHVVVGIWTFLTKLETANTEKEILSRIQNTSEDCLV